MSQRRVYDDRRHAHFLTFSCFGRRRLLDDDRAKQIVLDTLSDQLTRLFGKCIGFVVMPNHVHAIVWLSEPNCLSEFMKQWKRTSSYRIYKLFATVLVRYGAQIGDSPVWQAKYYDFNLYSRPKIEEKLTYMHLNPVRAGLVQKPSEWLWSSARYYEFREPVGVKIEWVD